MLEELCESFISILERDKFGNCVLEVLKKKAPFKKERKQDLIYNIST